MLVVVVVVSVVEVGVGVLVGVVVVVVVVVEVVVAAAAAAAAVAAAQDDQQPYSGYVYKTYVTLPLLGINLQNSDINKPKTDSPRPSGFDGQGSSLRLIWDPGLWVSGAGLQDVGLKRIHIKTRPALHRYLKPDTRSQTRTNVESGRTPGRRPPLLVALPRPGLQTVTTTANTTVVVVVAFFFFFEAC